MGKAFQGKQVEIGTVHSIDELQAPSGLSKKYSRENWMWLGMEGKEW